MEGDKHRQTGCPDSANEYIDRIQQLFDQLDRVNFKCTRESIVSLTLQLGLSKSRHANLLTLSTHDQLHKNFTLSTQEVWKIIRQSDEFYMSTNSEIVLADATLGPVDMKPPLTFKAECTYLFSFFQLIMINMYTDVPSSVYFNV